MASSDLNADELFTTTGDAGSFQYAPPVPQHFPPTFFPPGYGTIADINGLTHTDFGVASSFQHIQLRCADLIK